MIKPEETLEYWQKEVWQIQRCNHQVIDISIKFNSGSSIGGDYYMICTVTERKVDGMKVFTRDIALNSMGNNLWKRFRDLHKFLVGLQEQKILK